MTTPTPNPRVPLWIGGGADNSIEHARMLNWSIFQGSEGVLGNTDLEVKALTVPGAGVQVMPGGYVVVGRGLGQTYESYMGKYGQAVTVPVDPNNSASPRSDLLMLRIEDPNIAGEPWADPVGNANDYDYRNLYIQKGVPSTTRSVRQLGNTWSAIPLARIDIPALTATITQGMIVPLRTKCSPPSPPVPPPTIIIIENDDAPDNPDFLYSNLVSGPSSPANFPTAQVNVWRDFNSLTSWLVPIPKWANRADVILKVYSTQVNEDVWGGARVNIDNSVYTDSRDYDFNWTGGPGPEVLDLIAGGTVEIPSSMRGKNKRFKLQLQSKDVSSAHTGTLTFFRGSLAELRIVFKESC